MRLRILGLKSAGEFLVLFGQFADAVTAYPVVPAIFYPSQLIILESNMKESAFV